MGFKLKLGQLQILEQTEVSHKNSFSKTFIKSFIIAFRFFFKKSVFLEAASEKPITFVCLEKYSLKNGSSQPTKVKGTQRNG